jgi:hypothetical protein
MANNLLASLSTDQLRRAISFKEQIAALESQLSQMVGALAPAAPIPKPAKMFRRRLSAATRAKMAAAARARWAKQ